jgi:hypothetical protein
VKGALEVELGQGFSKAIPPSRQEAGAFPISPQGADRRGESQLLPAAPSRRGLTLAWRLGCLLLIPAPRRKAEVRLLIAKSGSRTEPRGQPGWKVPRPSHQNRRQGRCWAPLVRLDAQMEGQVWDNSIRPATPSGLGQHSLERDQRGGKTREKDTSSHAASRALPNDGAEHVVHHCSDPVALGVLRGSSLLRAPPCDDRDGFERLLGQGEGCPDFTTL